MPLHVERRDGVAVLTLDDPERRNALTAGLVDEIVAAIAGCETDDGVGAVVVTGAPPAFCSGADVSALGAMGAHDGRDAGRVRGIYDGFHSVRDCTLPTVAAVNGAAVGAGFNLALCCDVRLAGASARFDSRFARIGLHPGGNHLWMLERAVGPQAAAAMNLFGERVDGERAAELGLAWRCVDDDALIDEAVALAGRAAEVPRELARSVKQTLREVPFQPDFDAALATELERQRRSFESGFSAR
ncbi:MAG: enoyl-CoA hydratase-related protein [Acidimicrobiia bacterium]|nr:enoyl-CoA hydratase-related protein [Acidimicrobiia bacterium]